MEERPTIPGVSIGTRIGQGSCGQVYRGVQTFENRPVAVKVMPLRSEDDPYAEEEEARFKREVEVLAKLDHPNIAKVYYAGRTENHRYLVQEFIPGRSLEKELKFGSYKVEEAVAFLQGISDGLTLVHYHGITHRDIKPGNIMVQAGSRTRGSIIDFGTARTENSTLTQVGEKIYTPSYGSPEQFLGKVVDKRTDIYSMAATLYCMLAGRPPFNGSHYELMRHVLYDDAVPLSKLRPDLPTSLDQVMQCAMAKNPDHRYLTSEHFSRAFQRAVAQGSTRTADTATIFVSRQVNAAAARSRHTAPWRRMPTEERRPPASWWQMFREMILDS